MSLPASLHAQALNLQTMEKLRLIDDLLASISPTSSKIDQAWQQETEERTHAFEQGQLATNPMEEVLKKYAN